MSPLAEDLKAIGLTHTAAGLDDLVALATKRRWNTTQLLEHIVENEQRERATRSLERRVGRSRLGHFKPLADFDWAWPKRIDREAVEAAMRLDFLAAARNVVLIAPQGLGKTMLAQNIVHAALLAGHGALFITAAQMLLDLSAQESARALDRRLRYYTSRPLLCIDEIGYHAAAGGNGFEKVSPPGGMVLRRTGFRGPHQLRANIGGSCESASALAAWAAQAAMSCDRRLGAQWEPDARSAARTARRLVRGASASASAAVWASAELGAPVLAGGAAARRLDAGRDRAGRR